MGVTQQEMESDDAFVWTYSDGSGIVDANHVACALFRTTREEMIASPVSRFIHGRFSTLNKMRFDVLKSGPIQYLPDTEYILVRADGTQFMAIAETVREDWTVEGKPVNRGKITYISEHVPRNLNLKTE